MSFRHTFSVDVDQSYEHGVCYDSLCDTDQTRFLVSGIGKTSWVLLVRKTFAL